MELVVNGNVTITIELGLKTLALLTGGALAPAEVKPTKEAVTVVGAETAKKGAETVAKLEAEKKKETPKVEEKKEEAKKPTPTKETADEFYDLDDDAKLEELKSLVTKNTKKGKSSDIKFMLAQFDAARASELPTENYDEFYEALKRYMAGEATTDIFPEEDLS